MKISKIMYKTAAQVAAMPRFDMKKLPINRKPYTRPIIKLLYSGEVKKCNVTVNKINMEGIKPPYLLLCNHNSFVDFKVAMEAFYPDKANFVVAIDGFINREWLLRDVGCICKRKFVNDVTLVQNMKYCLYKLGSIVALYPEARYSLVGKTELMPFSLAKICKLLKMPIVTLITHGDHLRQPFWNNLNYRKVNISADMTYLLSVEQLSQMTAQEIFDKICKAFEYDDYKYQLQTGQKITEPNRAEGLNRPLYQCPACKKEHEMYSDGATLYCKNCGKEWLLCENGQLKAKNGETEFSAIGDWYDWERAQVRKQIEEGKYDIDIEVDIDSLPNSSGYYRIGRGRLRHNADGYYLTCRSGDEDFEFKKGVLENYSVHIEYAYFGKGDCVSISNANDTYYVFPVSQRDIVTKLHFATEELFKIKHAQIKESVSQRD